MLWSVRSPMDTLVITSPAPGNWPNRFCSRLYAPMALVPPALRKLWSDDVRPKLVGSPAAGESSRVLPARVPWATRCALVTTDDGNGVGVVDMVVMRWS